jgi:micrococcal nuclease
VVGARRRSVRRISTRLVIALLVLAAVAGASGVLEHDEGAAGTPGSATVTRVVDGDTVVLSGIGKSRLIGIDTPEVYGKIQCFGPQASAYAKRLLTGVRVRVRAGVERRDRYGRALVYLWLQDGRFVNELLVAGGWARTLEIAPNIRYAALLRRRAREARTLERGVWSRAACG